MRVLSCVCLLAALATTASATAIDDEITKLEVTLAKLKMLQAAETDNKEALKFMSAAAMASSANGSGSSTVEAGDTSDNSEFDIEPQPTRATTEAPSAAESASTASSTTSSGSVEATSSASAEASASASASASSSASTVVPTAFALVSAVVYALL